MRLRSDNTGGNVHDAVSFANRVNVAQFVFSIVPVSGGSSAIIIYKFDDYLGYCHWCKQMKLKPNSHEVFFSHGPCNSEECDL